MQHTPFYLPPAIIDSFLQEHHEKIKETFHLEQIIVKQYPSNAGDTTYLSIKIKEGAICELQPLREYVSIFISPVELVVDHCK